MSIFAMGMFARDSVAACPLCIDPILGDFGFSQTLSF